MQRRCIVCGQEPGDQCVYPRNMKEARRWQNLAKLSNLDTESLCQHCCVCASHLGTGQESNSDPGSTPDAVSGAKGVGGKMSARSQSTSDQPPNFRWSYLGSYQRQSAGSQDSCCCYPTSNKTNVEMPRQSQQSLDTRPPKRNNVNRFSIGLYRCRAAMLQGNHFQQTPRSTYGTSTQRNLKPNQPAVPDGCPCSACPVMRNFKPPLLRNTSPTPETCTRRNCPRRTAYETVPSLPEGCTCPVLRNFKPSLLRNTGHTLGACNRITSQRRQGNNNQGQKRPISCDRRWSTLNNQEPFQRKSDFLSSPSTSTDPGWPSSPSNSRTTLNNQMKRPRVKNKCCQIRIPTKLRDQEVQCCTTALQPKDSSTTDGQSGSSTIKSCSASSKGFSSTIPSSFGQRRSSSATRYCCKCPSSTGNANMQNFGCVNEQEQYSNAVNVLLMNGSRKNNYGDLTPTPEICVQASDLADCNERAVFPDIDKPNYRVCRAATSDPKAEGQKADQIEANVLVLEEDRMDSFCSEDDSHQAQGQSKVQAGATSFQNQSVMQLASNNPAVAANYTKVLEMQRARINELENLLQQHSMLQQTIQARVAELQCTDKPAERPDKT